MFLADEFELNPNVVYPSQKVSEHKISNFAELDT